MKCLFRITLTYLLLINLFLPLTNPVYIEASTLEGAVDFELKSIGGKTFRLSELRGKAVLLNFWATWCPECIKEMPSLERLYKRFRGDDFIILGISIDRKASTVETFLQKNPVSYPILMDSKGDVFVKKYTLIGIPVTILIDKDGYIVEKVIGKQDFTSEKYVGKIEKLL